jgi:hypothetical protein
MLYLQPTVALVTATRCWRSRLPVSWTAVGRGTKDTGRAVFTTEYRFKMGSQPPSAVGREIGTLVPPTNAFNDRGWVIRDAYWIQRLFDARVRIIIGRADPSDYVGAYWLQNVNNSFVNRHFSANPAVPFPGHGPLLGISIRPTDLYYITAGTCNAYSQTIRADLTLFNEWIFHVRRDWSHPNGQTTRKRSIRLGFWHWTRAVWTTCLRTTD